MKKVFLSLISLYLLGCGGGDTSSGNEGSTPVNTSCLAAYVDNNEIEKMITAEQLAAIVEKSSADLEFSDGKASTAKYSTFRYEWEPDQERSFTMEMKVGDQTISQEMPLNNGVNIGYLEVLDPKEKTPLEYFDFVYGPKSDEQKQLAKENIDKAVEESEDVDEQSAEVIKSMVDKQNEARVEGVGDRAYGGVGNAQGLVYYKLKVLHGNTMFEVTTDVSDDSREDIRIAKAVAQQIIDNCN